MSVTKHIDGDEMVLEQLNDDTVEVVNFSYHDLENHRYIVSVGEDGAEYALFCSCPAHKYNDEACKHRRAVQAALNGGAL